MRGGTLVSACSCACPFKKCKARVLKKMADPDFFLVKLISYCGVMFFPFKGSECNFVTYLEKYYSSTRCFKIGQLIEDDE